MKVRMGFISNSSSSSFIVIGSRNIEVPTNYKNENFIIDHKLGNTQFGWEKEKYTDFGSRVTFATLQALYIDRKDKTKNYKLNKLTSILKKALQCKNIYVNISINSFNSLDSGYIDHQSSAEEGENIEMFESDEALFNFLFSKDSFIQGGNDNDW